MTDPSAESVRPSSKFSQLAVLTFFSLTVFGPVWVWLLVLSWSFMFFPFLPVLICYTSYIATSGLEAAESMSWTKQRWKWWRHMQEYFPAKLHKVADLDPQKTYILAFMPHGIISLSSWIHFVTEITGFQEMYPGIKLRALTLKHFFLTPGIREYALCCGLRIASRRAMTNILGSGPGSAVMLVPGGAAEALLSAPGTMDLYTAKRKGFVKLAVETGSCLVPVLAFGETNTFDSYVPVEGSTVQKSLQVLKKYFGFSTPLFWGNGYFEGMYGIMPKQVPLNTVIGAPIEVPKYEAQSSKDEKMIALVDEYHAKFLEATQKLWDDHKDKFVKNRKRELRFV